MSELLDKSWETVQIKAFTAWINQTVQQQDESLKVSDLATDLSNGVMFINFFQLLSGKKVKQKWVPTPKNRIVSIQNNHCALSFMENEMEVRNPGISAEEIADGNLKLLLGLLWTLFRKYRIAVIEEEDKSSEEGLLLWCTKMTEGYDGVKIHKFKDSFTDGLAYLALTHRFNPGKSQVDFSSYNKADKVKNLEAAFDYAETELGIPKLLDAEEVADQSVDERSIILYTSLFFHAFNSAKDRDAIEAEQRAREEQLEAEKLRKAQLAEDNDNLLARVEELEKQLQEATSERDELKEKTTYLEEKIEVMKQLMEQETEEKAELQEVNSQVTQEVEDLKKRLEIALSSQEEGEKELSAKLHNSAKKVSELQELTASLESDNGSFKMELEELRVKLGEETHDRQEKEKEITENREQSKIQLSGLGALKRNLDQHVDDLHRWQKYLEYDKKATLDFEVDVKAPLSEAMETQNFKEQLELLSGKLGEENDAMLKILKAKEVDAKAAALTKKKAASKKK